MNYHGRLLLNVACIFHAGHLGPDELAAAAIATTYFNLMWYGSQLALGECQAVGTLRSMPFPMH